MKINQEEKKLQDEGKFDDEPQRAGHVCMTGQEKDKSAERYISQTGETNIRNREKSVRYRMSGLTNSTKGIL